jgi:hypothetical protein
MADLMVSRVAGPSTWVYKQGVKLMERPGSSYRLFIYDSPPWLDSKGQEQKITLLEELAAIQAGTTGLRTWTAAYVKQERYMTIAKTTGYI